MERWLQPKFAGIFPLAFIMRVRLPELWLRVHSLPASKRYAESDEERRLLLERYARFAGALLGEGSSCHIVVSRMNDSALDPRGLGYVGWRRLPEVRESEEDVWYSWAAPIEWKFKIFRSFLLDIADDRTQGVSFVSSDSGNIFAPYDGGSDGFTFDSKLHSRLRREFKSWLSAREDGL